MKLLGDILKIAVFVGLIFLQIEEGDWLRSTFGKFSHYITSFLRLVVFLLGFDIIRVWLIRIHRRRVQNSSRQDNFVVGLRHIYTLLVIIGIFIFLLALFKVDIKQFFISLALFAAAIAILFKDYISNVINGMIITFSDELSIGDQVKINEHKGKIVNINLQSIHLLNDDDDLIYIPNNLVFNTFVLNYTKRDTKKISIDFAINLHHLESVDSLEQKIVETLRDYHNRIVQGSFRLKVEDIKKDEVHMKFQYILLEHDKELEREIRRRTVRKVVELIKES